jgi:D-alanyl-D-alanine carboxypeptidase
MRCVTVGRKTVVALFVGLGVALSLSALVEPAEARSRKRTSIRTNSVYSPPFAALVVDVNTGKTLYARNENDLRHPASVTKVMTLYMLFEQLERGKLTLDSEIEMTAHAASMAPSKLGLRPGQTISVENAIKALVTKSANDVAAAVADHIGGSEERFADMMTAKAKALGMTRTNYANASGLPDPDQVTTARDLVTLGRAIQDRFPRYFGYFSTHNFRYGRANMRNHNNLLGRVEGMDGIKTGYTRASGFNLLSSVKRDNRRIMAVVIGGRSAGVRDNIMANLIEEHIDKASPSRSAPLVAEREQEEKRRPMATARWEAPTPKADIKVEPKPQPIADLRPEAKIEAAAAPSGKPMQLGIMSAYAPVQEKVRPAVVSSAKLDDSVKTASIPSKALDGSTPGRASSTTTTAATPTTTPNMRWVQGPAGAKAKPPVAKPELAVPAKPSPVTKVAKVEPVKEPTKAEAAKLAATKATGVMIQIGATDDAGKANELLAKARSSSKGALASARPFTEKVQKGRDTLYRARFAGLEESQAEAACKSLKRSGFACFTTKN